METEKKGRAVSILCIVLNLILAGTKFAVGAVSGLVSVLADGVNNLSDCGSGAVLLVSMHISKKPADREHPYGHQRAEYVASLLIGCIILLFAVEFLRESIEKCISGTLSQGNVWLYIVLGASVAVKAGMAVLYFTQAKALGSQTFSAAGIDSASDCIATLSVIAGVLISQYAALPADGYVGILVAVFIGWEGISVLRDASSSLLGKAPEGAVTDTIRSLILSGDGVLGVHDLRVYRYGPHTYFATAHIETDAKLSALASHEYIDAVEKNVLQETGVMLTAHCDPVVLDDGEAIELEERIRAAVTGMYENMDLHDFRLVRGARKKIVFEVGVPFACKEHDDKIRADVESAVSLLTDAEAVITVERE